MLERTIQIQNKEGFHARPATVLIKEASKYGSNIEIEYNGRLVSCKSIISLMTLKARQGDTVKVYAYGEDESEAMDSITELFENKFGEAE
ncbi:phosphotransferase system HPr (HPr) family protein [Anaerosolibacter carboniphilus]|uniref:Phosphotransferase system HPr (HPr) family protein n=1 Tax=Anaerosolibacter carboniphilus TaxID=1417629 RepID=A0A841L9D1_9FIRM|nr:HPr family phosphocarrier protein [Anaerosolibacter carboniphilus]MBB6218855.1 phosphotransferase system HPr (HPr) family protein [Anaerosolibacter carboniphilus]